MALTKEQVTLITVAALGKAPGEDHLNYFITSATAGEFIVNGGTTNINTLLPYDNELEAVAAVLQHERAYLETKNGLTEQTDAQFVASVVANLGAANGDSLTAALANGTPRYKALVDFALAEEAKGPIANVTNAAGSLDDVEQNLIDAGTPANPGNEIYLTVGSDRNVATTAGDDVIVANVVNNDLGILINELSTGDVIDGGAGYDVLKASLVRDNRWDNDIDPRPTVKNVEEIRIEALEDVTLDADRISNETHYASDRSRSDLTITNVAIESNQITQDITLEMKNTIANNINLTPNSTFPGMSSNFNVYFDETSLREQGVKNEADAEFYIQLADALQEDAAAPLTNVRITDLQVTHDGNVIELSNIESDDDTYEGLVRAVQAALDEAGFGGRYKAELGPEFNEVANVATKVPGFNVVVKDTNEQAVSFAEEDVLIGVGNKLGSGSSASVQGDSGVVFESSNQTFKVTSNIILDGVGRGSNGGDLTIGSMSTSNSSTGVEVFDIEVRNNSNLGDFYSTNGALDELKIVNGEGYTGDLTLRNELNDDKNHNSINGGEKILVENFAGNINLGTVNAIKNVDTIDARITGNVTLKAEYDGTGLASDSQEFVINTGTGKDTITATVGGGSTSGSTDTELTITAAGGNNTVTLTQGAAPVTAAVANDVEVITDSGEDTVTGGGTNLTANTGAGNDVIYAENTGLKAVLEIDATNGTLASVATDIQFLYGKQIQVTLAAPGDADDLAIGFESELIDIVTGTARLTNVDDLNQAIIKAINGDPVLSKLATASVDSNGKVFVSYLVDGAQNAAGVEVKFYGKEWNGTAPAPSLTASERNTIEKAYHLNVQDSSIDVGALYDAAVVVGTTAVDSKDANATSTLALGGTFDAGNIITIKVGSQTITVAANENGATNVIETGDAIVEALAAEGISASNTTGTVTIASSETVTSSVAHTFAITPTMTATMTATGLSSVGVDSTTAGVNTVNGGAGDDVIVLSTTSGTKDTVIFNANNFGNDTIVNFTTTEDVLDFRAWLNTKEHGTSISAESQVRIATTSSGNAVLSANEVEFVSFSSTATDTFEGLTASVLKAALNTGGTANYGNLTTTTMASDNTASFGTAIGEIVGNSYNSLILVENDKNAGEYKVFEVIVNSADAATGILTDIKLAGTVDFGETGLIAGVDFA